VAFAFDGAEPDGLRRGQSLRLRLALGDSEEALLLPRGAFFQQTGGAWAYVVEDGGEAVRRPLRLGRQNPQQFEVLGGLQPGDRVVVSSYDAFGDADRLVLD
jgi:HlyD family secretion protein